MIYELDDATEDQCLDMIDYFLSLNDCEEAVIKYTERLHFLVDERLREKNISKVLH
jgi:hypothetical protein